MVPEILLDAVDGLHPALLIFNELLMRLDVGVVRVKLRHELHVTLLLRVELLLPSDCFHFADLGGLRFIRAD